MKVNYRSLHKAVVLGLFSIFGSSAIAQQNIPPSTPETYKGVVKKTLA